MKETRKAAEKVDKIKLENILNKKTLSEMTSEELKAISPEVEKMRGFNQNNPHHCYDLEGHTEAVINELKEEGNDLMVAALFHDIGKPAVAFEKDGRTVFYGHAAKSAEIAEPILKEMGYGEEDLKWILFLISHHDDFISYKMDDLTEKSVKKKISSVQRKAEKDGTHYPSYEDYLILLKLCCADANAQAEEVYQNGVKISSKQEKLKKLNKIKNIIKGFI